MRDRSTSIQYQAKYHPVVSLTRPRTAEEHCLQLIHRKAYEEAASLAAGRVVLDVGCNIGHGTLELSRAAAVTVGVDVSWGSVSRARLEHADTGIEFVVSDGARLPFGSGRFDVVTSFQIIEHVPRPEEFVAEIGRVLKREGVAVFTTPNAEIRVDPGCKPWNRFHIREYSAVELQQLLAPHFAEVEVLGLFADGDLYDLEYRRCQRMRQIAAWRAGKTSRIRSWHQFEAAALGTALRVLPEGFAQGARAGLQEVVRFIAGDRTDEMPGSTSDFYYRRDGLADSLDLIAFCRKPLGTVAVDDGGPA